MSKGNKFLQKN